MSTLVIKEGENNIGDKGCQYLTKGNWPHLKKLILGKYEFRQGRIEYQMKGVFSSQKTGRSCLISIYVSFTILTAENKFKGKGCH